MGSAALDEPPAKVQHVKEEATKEAGEGDDAADVSVLHVYEDETKLRILVCGEADLLDAPKLKEMEAGLSSLIVDEVKSIRLLHRISAPPPPMAAAALVRGVVTMRCDVCTTSGARIPLLVSGGGHTCFDDQLLEAAIRKELSAKDRLVQLVKFNDETKVAPVNSELRRSIAVAGGAPIVELRIATPAWAAQILRQLSSEVCFRRFAELGIAGVEGAPVAAFQKDDALRLSKCNPRIHSLLGSSQIGSKYVPAMPSWLSSPSPSRKRRKLLHPSLWSNGTCSEEDVSTQAHREDSSGSSGKFAAGESVRPGPQRPPPLLAMKPVPHTTRRKLMPFAAAVLAGAQTGWSMKLPLPNGGTSRSRPTATTGLSAVNMNGNTPACDINRPPSGGGMLAPFNFPASLVKPHGCSRPPMEKCAEEEFLQDLIQFLISRGHGKHVPPGGPDSFPEAVLNGGKLDLYNLYKEVVSRGGFHVGNGINWKGQIFSKMRNHTTINKMTGVGNTLKKHYETYLLEYEFAHNDVDGECCILCHSGAAGDWVNCGVCGEWAHLGCDRRGGLAAFKDYAKTDGLEYICPHCSTGNGKVVSRRAKLRSPLMAQNSEVKEQIKARLVI